MKPIQVMFDEQLLAQLDADHEVKRHGRSAVMRRAVAQYLRRRREREIAEAYRSAYADAPEDLEGWENEGRWPED